MRLTTRGKMAVTAVTDMALRSHGNPIALPSISARQGISLSYLEDIFSALRRAGLVSSIRGPGGGYTLALAPKDLSVANIVMAAETHMSRPGSKTADAPTEPATPSSEMTADLWASFHSRVMDYLQSITVADLIAQQQARGVQQASTAPSAATKKSRPAKTQLPARNVPNSVFALGLLGSSN